MNSPFITGGADMTRYPFESIAAKLSGYVEESQKVRVINSFAHQDPVRDKANLLILKQFGVVPHELNSRYGEIEIKEFVNLDAYDGLTIFIESILITNVASGNNSASNNQVKKTSANVISPDLNQLNKSDEFDVLTEGHVNIINQQTRKLGRVIETKRQDFRGGYIYISGFSCIATDQKNDDMPESEYLPWYFELGNVNGFPKMFTHPELDYFLRNLSEQPPLIANLDDFLEGIHDSESLT